MSTSSNPSSSAAAAPTSARGILKGILRSHKNSYETAADFNVEEEVPITNFGYETPTKEKRFTWDEDNLKNNSEIQDHIMKFHMNGVRISEPKTPYVNYEEADEEGENSDLENLPSPRETSSKVIDAHTQMKHLAAAFHNEKEESPTHKVKIQAPKTHHHHNHHHNQIDESEEEEEEERQASEEEDDDDEDNNEEEDEDFVKKRKQHYNEFLVLKRLRESGKFLDEDEEEIAAPSKSSKQAVVDDDDDDEMDME